MKMLVIDVRNNQRLFGEVVIANNSQESDFGFDKTDMIQVGTGDQKTIIPASAASIKPNVNELPAEAIDCDHVASAPVAE